MRRRLVKKVVGGVFGYMGSQPSTHRLRLKAQRHGLAGACSKLDRTVQTGPT
jgi:hypothetical protein